MDRICELQGQNKKEDVIKIIVERLNKDSFTVNDFLQACRDKKISISAAQLNDIACSYDKKLTEEKAFQVYLYAAELGNPDAIGNVAVYYYCGLAPCDENLQHAIEWCQKAIDGGIVSRNILMAQIFEKQKKYYKALNCLLQVLAGKCDDEDVKEAEKLKSEITSKVENLKREMIEKDLVLYRGARDLRKISEIGVDIDPSGLNLHQRQSLAERLAMSGVTNLHNINSRSVWPKTTYVVASFGMVITDRPHQKGGDHKRIFKTVPVQVSDLAIIGKLQEAGDTGHAEEGLYDYLLRKQTIDSLLKDFKKHFGINAFDHKIYAVVLDLHGTYDMCLSCAKKGEFFQENFRQLLLNCLPDCHLKASTNYFEQLPVIIRYTSDITYDFVDATRDDKKGLLWMYNTQPARTLPVNSDGRYKETRDIRCLRPELLLHGTKDWHGCWTTTKQSEYKDRNLSLESWTAFVTSKSYSETRDNQKAIHFSYTRLGLVETFDPTEEATAGVGNLKFGS